MWSKFEECKNFNRYLKIYSMVAPISFIYITAYDTFSIAGLPPAWVSSQEGLTLKPSVYHVFWSCALWAFCLAYESNTCWVTYGWSSEDLWILIVLVILFLTLLSSTYDCGYLSHNIGSQNSFSHHLLQMSLSKTDR